MPIDRGAIDAQLREIGEGERWWEEREFRDLPHILHEDERIAAITKGKLLGRRRPRVPGGRWILVATTQRLLCLKQGRLVRKQVDFVPGQIIRIRQSSGVRGHTITLETPSGRYRIRIPKEDSHRFAGALGPLSPSVPKPGVHPALEPFARIPGMTAVAALLAPPDQVTRAQMRGLEATVERLQVDVERLQEQVAFLESLLQRKSEEPYLPHSAAGSLGPGASP